MSETQSGLPNSKLFRAVAFAFASILSGFAIWILTAEIVRPRRLKFTTDVQFAVADYARRDAAVLAARIGLVRGDLWSEAAFAYGDILWPQIDSASNERALPLERIRALTEMAINFAPHETRLWLLLAGDYLRLGSTDEQVGATLKMSYYTGSNTVAIVPERLLLATQSGALKNDELQDLVRHDIQLIVAQKTELMPALIAAYINAPLFGQQFIEKAVSELDPEMLAALRAQRH